MEKPQRIKTLLAAIIAIYCSITLVSSVGAANLMQTELSEISNPHIEVSSEYFSIEHITTTDGTELSAHIINGPSQPPVEFETERADSMLVNTPEGILSNFPSYSWVFGCSAVSAAMIAAWYDRANFPNIYTGPTNGGVMPLSDTAWPRWSDGKQNYPSNPLVATRQGLDGNSSRGSIEDYWVESGSYAPDPYLGGGWQQHQWGAAIGDYMKSSQSNSGNIDGSTIFHNFYNGTGKFRCSDMENAKVDHIDGTYGRKLFYRARGYTVGDCYNQRTENVSGGFTLANLKAEIDAGYPVLLNLEGHSVVAYGYSGSTVYIRDTWDDNPNNVYTMPWGGSYCNMKMMSVSVVHPKIFITNNHLYLPVIRN